MIPSDISWVGENLSRPECVVAEADGTVWVSDDRGGITRIGKDGKQSLVGVIPGLPNGIAIDSDGTLLVAEIEHGVLYRIHRNGRTDRVLDSIAGRPIGAANFVHIDIEGRCWVTVSTRLRARREAATQPKGDGYIFLLKDGAPHVVATGLNFPNELRLAPSGDFLVLAETASRRILKINVAPDGTLTKEGLYGPEDMGGRPDGLAFDAQGGLWVTDVDNNRLLRILPDGTCDTMLSDPEGRTLDFPSSLAFAGRELDEILIGSTRLKRIARLRSSVAGAPMSHWDATRDARL